MTTATILLIAAFIVACLAAFNVPAKGVSLGWLSFAFFLLSLLVGPLGLK